MKKFKFELETVERVRKMSEDKSLLNLAEKQRDHQKLLEIKSELEQMLKNSLSRREQLGSHPVHAHDFALEEKYILGMKQRIQKVEHAIYHSHKKLNKAHFEYNECRKKRKMFTQLRENALNNYKEAVQQDELKKMDDLMIMRSRVVKRKVA